MVRLRVFQMKKEEQRKDRLIVTNTDPGLPNYKLMSWGNFALSSFLPFSPITTPPIAWLTIEHRLSAFSNSLYLYLLTLKVSIDYIEKSLSIFFPFPEIHETYLFVVQIIQT